MGRLRADMMRKEQRYDPKIYGSLKAKFLENLADSIPEFYKKPINDQERERLKLIKDIKEGRLAPTKREAEG